MRAQSLRSEIFFTPESAVRTLLFTPMPASSHFDMLIFMPEKVEKLSKVRKIAVTESRSATKKVVSSAYADKETQNQAPAVGEQSRLNGSL